MAGRARLAGRLTVAEARPGALTIEAIVALDSPREFRVHPRDRVVAYTAEAAGARQLFTIGLRGTGQPPTQVTASEHPVSDPQWSPDGRRLAFVREDEIWIVDADGSRLTKVIAKPDGGTAPRWSPDGLRLAFLSRRRGWSQVWRIDAPVPRRGRPARDPRPPEARALTPTGVDLDGLAWSPDGRTIAVHGQLRHDRLDTNQVALVDADGGELQVVGGEDSHDAGPVWMADGSLLFVSDADGWFQVVRRSPDGRDRFVLTDGEREHGEPSGGLGYVPLPSPDGTRTRPHRGPRRPHRPGRPDARRRRPSEARPRPTTEGATDRQRRRGRRSARAALPVGRRVALRRLAR